MSGHGSSRHRRWSARSSLVIACGGKDEAPFAVGTLERDRVELRAETDDPIVEIAAREGDDLAAGALVLRLDDARLAAQRERAAARRDEARARLAELVRGPRQERLAEARARLEGDDNAVAIAERELERARDLAGSGVVPAQRVDERRRELRRRGGAPRRGPRRARRAAQRDHARRARSGTERARRRRGRARRHRGAGRATAR